MFTSGALRIFISYRHEDAPAHAGRLADHLADRFGQDDVFMDIDSIDPGLDFREALKDAIDACDVLVVAIGRDWLGAVDSDGHRRLEDPDDYVRLEIEAALERNVRVIPVLLDGGYMPSAGDLPGDLAPLCFRNAMEIGNKHFHSDVTDLISRLEKIEQAKASAGGSPTQVRSKTRFDRKALGLALAVLLVGGAVTAAIVIATSGGGSTKAGGGATVPGGQPGMSHIQRLVPDFGKWNCAQGRPSSPAVDEQAACTPQQGADSVKLILFKSMGAADAAYMKQVHHANVISPTKFKPNTGRCTSQYWGGEVKWVHAKGVTGGRKLCYLTSSYASYLIWSYDDVPLLVTAHRADEAHGLLDHWFSTVAHEIGTGGAMHMG